MMRELLEDRSYRVTTDGGGGYGGVTAATDAVCQSVENTVSGIYDVETMYVARDKNYSSAPDTSEARVEEEKTVKKETRSENAS